MALPNNYYYPTGYQPYVPPMPTMAMPQQTVPQVQQVQQTAPQPQPSNNQSNGLIWVQSEAGAKAYPVAPNNSVLLMDSEESTFYIKTTDSSGVPQPLRIFDYTERTKQSSHIPQVAPEKPTPDMVTRAEFEKLREDVTRLSKGIRKPQVNKDKEE